MAIVDSWALTSQMSTNYMYVYERLTIIRVFREIVYFVRIFKTNRFFFIYIESLFSFSAPQYIWSSLESTFYLCHSPHNPSYNGYQMVLEKPKKSHN